MRSRSSAPQVGHTRSGRESSRAGIRDAAPCRSLSSVRPGLTRRSWAAPQATGTGPASRARVSHWSSRPARRESEALRPASCPGLEAQPRWAVRLGRARRGLSVWSRSRPGTPRRSEEEPAKTSSAPPSFIRPDNFCRFAPRHYARVWCPSARPRCPSPCEAKRRRSATNWYDL